MSCRAWCWFFWCSWRETKMRCLSPKDMHHLYSQNYTVPSVLFWWMWANSKSTSIRMQQTVSLPRVSYKRPWLPPSLPALTLLLLELVLVWQIAPRRSSVVTNWSLSPISCEEVNPASTRWLIGNRSSTLSGLLWATPPAPHDEKPRAKDYSSPSVSFLTHRR